MLCSVVDEVLRGGGEEGIDTQAGNGQGGWGEEERKNLELATGPDEILVA